MPNAVQIQSNPVASLPRLPDWLDRIVSPPDHPDLPWRPPAKLPSEADLRRGISALESLLAGNPTPPVVKQCIAKLMIAFEPNTKLTVDETRLRMVVWSESCADLCDALWLEATQDCIKSLKWMPKPAEFRAAVEPKMIDAKRKLTKLRAMLDEWGQPEHAKPRETPQERMRGMIATYRKFPRYQHKAITLEHEFAAYEGRAPEAWAMEAPDEPEAVAPMHRPPFKPDTSPRGKRLAALAAAHRMGVPPPEWTAEKADPEQVPF